MSLIENDVSRDDDLVIGEVKTPVAVDVLPPTAYHRGTRGSIFGLRRMPNSMVNARDSRFILVQALDRRSSNNLMSSRP